MKRMKHEACSLNRRERRKCSIKVDTSRKLSCNSCLENLLTRNSKLNKIVLPSCNEQCGHKNNNVEGQ
jgi:hypothetical protein